MRASQVVSDLLRSLFSIIRAGGFTFVCRFASCLPITFVYPRISRDGLRVRKIRSLVGLVLGEQSACYCFGRGKEEGLWDSRLATGLESGAQTLRQSCDSSPLDSIFCDQLAPLFADH